MKAMDFYEALSQIQNKEEWRVFLKDLCTPSEIKAMEERWAVVRLLDEGTHSYREIHQLTGASLTTITRVARFLKQESNQGYRMILDRLKR